VELYGVSINYIFVAKHEAYLISVFGPAIKPTSCFLAGMLCDNEQQQRKGFSAVCAKAILQGKAVITRVVES
jgi:hypothetical protein